MTEDLGDFDVIVVGAGGAGLATTIAAARDGARVLLVEKTDRLGGMLHIANGEMSGAGTRRQRARGIDDDPERHWADVRRIAHDLCDAELAGRSVRAQGETIDWLDDLGFDFDPHCPGLIHGHEVYTTPRTYWGVRLGLSVLEVLAAQVDRLAGLGRVSAALDTRVERLLPARHGGVGGVALHRGHGPDSGTAAAHAPAVVLATGGYEADKELRDTFLPGQCRDALIGCLDHATGDGLRLAGEFGAQATRYGRFIPIMGLIPDPDRPGFAVDYRIASVQLPPEYRVPHEIWVNADGQRFVAEDDPSPEHRERALLTQPRVTMHIVWDQDALERAEPLLTNGTRDWTRERMAAECANGRWIRRAETPGELAHELGVPAEALEASIRRYNDFVARGADADFGRRLMPHPLRRPPFYGLTSTAASLLSRDGLAVDGRTLAVLDGAGQPIPGLYAVGEVLGNNAFAGDTYVGGMSITPALTLGRLLGAELAAASVAR
jgi:fumarate reductase flavoprotein subunit